MIDTLEPQSSFTLGCCMTDVLHSHPFFARVSDERYESPSKPKGTDRNELRPCYSEDSKYRLIIGLSGTLAPYKTGGGKILAKAPVLVDRRTTDSQRTDRMQVTDRNLSRSCNAENRRFRYRVVDMVLRSQEL